MEVLTPLFYEDPPILLTPTPVSNFVQPSLPLSPNPCHLHPPHQGFFLLSCFFCWMGDHATFDVLFYLMIIWIYTCQASVPYYQKDLDVYFMQQGVKSTVVWHIVWFFTGTLILYHTHTHMHTHKYTQCKTRFFLWNTTNTDRNGLNKTHVHTHTHTPKTQRKRTLGQVS